MVSRVLRETVIVYFTLVLIVLQFSFSFHMVGVMKEVCVKVVAEKLIAALNSSITLAVALNCSVVFPLNISYVDVHIVLNNSHIRITLDNLILYVSIEYSCSKVFEMVSRRVYIISHVSSNVFEVRIWET